MSCPTPLATDEDDRPPTHDGNGRFVTGNNLGQGRPVGSRNKLSEAYCEALWADFQVHGTKAIEELRQKDLVSYCKAVGAIVPKDFQIQAQGAGLVIVRLSDEDMAL